MNDKCVELDLDEEETQMLIDVGANILLACAVAGKTYKDVIEWLLQDTELGGMFAGENKYMKETD